MIVQVLQLIGVIGFVATTVVERRALDADPTPENARRTSRVTHAAFYLGLVAPYAVGLLVPGPAALDRSLHLPSLSIPLVPRLSIAIALLIVGGYFSFASNTQLARRGKGALAFKLTRDVVDEKVYGRVRNPMSLGFYLGCVAFVLLTQSTYLLIYGLLLVVPAHIFYLKYFEEHELAVRYGASYVAYRDSTPFLIPRLSTGAAGPGKEHA